jgi:hypothetical protein
MIPVEVDMLDRMRLESRDVSGEKIGLTERKTLCINLSQEDVGIKYYLLPPVLFSVPLLHPQLRTAP